MSTKNFSIVDHFSDNGEFHITPIIFDGEPIFLCQEIESSLGYSDLSHSVRTSNGMKEGVDYFSLDGDKLMSLRDILRRGKSNLQISPMARSLIVLTESGFYAMACKSSKEECVRFRIWVTSKVLPKIRKTGTYSKKEHRPPVIATISTPEDYAHNIIKNCLSVAKMLRCPEHIAQTEAVKSAHLKTGVDHSPLLLSAPAQDDIQAEEEMLEPSDLAKYLGIEGKSKQVLGRRANIFLEQSGLQVRVNGGWVPTSEGKKYCSTHHWKKNAKTGYNLKWNVSHVQSLYADSVKRSSSENFLWE